jgi:hypothetical protein
MGSVLASMRHPKESKLDKLIDEALLMEAKAAKEAGTLGYMAHALVQATLPHSKQHGPEFTRRNGAFTLSLLAPSHIGLPYGSIPRLLVSWVTTEAVRTKDRELVLGDNLSQFMRELGMVSTGGRWGTVTRLKDQIRRLFASSVTCSYDGGGSLGIENLRMVDSARLWWDPQIPGQATLWESTLTLSEQFFEEVTRRPVPIDMRALKVLRQSPMALDIYCWLTYRLSYLTRPTVLPWAALQAQFGADYTELRYFRRKFLEHLKAVSVVYPAAKIDALDHGLELRPSPPHIPKL